MIILVTNSDNDAQDLDDAVWTCVVVESAVYVYLSLWSQLIEAKFSALFHAASKS